MAAAAEVDMYQDMFYVIIAEEPGSRINYKFDAVSQIPSLELPFAILSLGCYDKHQKHDWEIRQKYNKKIQYKV